MNLNILAYCVYGLVSIIITVFVGKAFHKNGYFYVISIFVEEQIATAINNLLLIGYYLLNIGFVIYKISDWRKITNTIELVENLSFSLALIFILLGLMNLVNIAVLSFFRKRKHIIN